MAAGYGTLEASFSQVGNQIIDDPNGPWIYATVPSINGVAIYDTRTLTLVKTFFSGSTPDGLGLSADSKTLYIANSGSNFLGVYNTTTGTSLPALQIAVKPNRVEAGLNNRLYVLGEGKITQVDATTGATIGNQAGAWDGEIALNPSKTTLVFGNTGLSPGRIDKYDISTSTMTTTGGFDFGGNDRALSMSHNGSVVTFASAGTPYSIQVFRTSDLVQLGQFNLGGPPAFIAWSPDDSEVYVRTVYVNTIYVFDPTTYLLTKSFEGPSNVRDMVVDATGKHLFFTTDNGIMSYAVPEPASLGLIGLASLALMGRRRRR